MRVSLPQIETFYWIARLGSFHAAALRLNLTQPTVSVRIRALESELGVALFDRSQSRARLTTEGTTLLPHAERMLTLAAEMKRDAKPGGGLRGLLRLGAVESVARLAVPHLVAHLSATQEELLVELSVDVGSSLSRRLNDRELDVVIITDPRPSEHVRTELLGLMELSWIVGAQHRLAGRNVRPADLQQERIFVHPKGSTTHFLVEAWFRAAHVEPARLNLCNSMATMGTLVSAGLGLAVVTPAMYFDAIADGTILRLKATPSISSRPLYLCCLREAWSDEIVDLAQLTRALLKKAGTFVAE